MRHIKEKMRSCAEMGICMVIGVTGGIGCGKSTVMGILENDYGAKVLIADDIGHEVMKKGMAAYEEILAAFGESVKGENGELDRTALAERIYGDDRKRARLNEIIHPHVIKEIKNRLAEWKNEPLVVLETALMFETGCDKLCCQVWGIDTQAEERIRRLIRTRGYTREKAEAIMEKQLSAEEYRNRCDVVIDNSGTPDSLKGRLSELLLGIKRKI